MEDVPSVFPPATTPERDPTRLVRRSGGSIIGGVAGGIADHLGIDPFKVRVAFVLLAALAGAGIVAYGLIWVFTPSGSDTARPSAGERRRAYGLAIMGLGLAAALSWMFSGTAGQVIVPILVVVIGAGLIWHEFDSDASRSIFGLPDRPTVLTWSRIVAGATLIVVGLAVVVLARVDLDALRPALLAVAVTLFGVGLLTVPLWLRTMRALNAERAARIRNEEREEIASHLHDSVLQTLALIQRQASNAQEVNRLARSQERELRTWLFDEPERPQSSLAAALRRIAGEVEDQYGVKVTPVIVGDVAPTGGPGQNHRDAQDFPRERFTALLGATREALVNAAKHSGVAEVDLFAECEDDRVSVFVRDRGVGFDIDEIPADRQGLSRSIRGRVERRGGEVELISGTGRGTEVRIRMARGGKGADAGRTFEPAAAETDDAEQAEKQDQMETKHREEQPR
ncbi:PspC domain-containing protein [Aldersonia sp. NBC_00410]|uniref:ATP-binding protein n=1 Tax=Aldersonia sp. NBC_00410 TaxID=2975954 RepID=UPI00224F36FD|nr:ATP-binding protein [Aldersonia sp. NBC_00410]MCX5045463.1 PspC domain-containing protein [Aldersonia sp. NBC_00410]